MKVTQNVTISFNSCYDGWSGLEFKDEAENRVTVSMTDDTYLKLEKVVTNKCDDIRGKRAEALAEQIAAQTQEDSDE
jgi:hypothetical protein